MPRRRCPVCRSKQWHKEPSSGLIACSEGHVLQNYRNEVIDTGAEAGAHTMKRRAMKSERKKKTSTSRANPKLYHGDRARYFYFQCQQLILRHQVLALRKLWHLPPEFEIICRDIWALHLSLLPSPPPAEPYFYTHGGDDANATAASSEARGPDPGAMQETADDDTEPGGGDKHSDSDSAHKSDERDQELDQLMREIESSSSSSDDCEGDDTTKRIPPGKNVVWKLHSSRQEHMASTISTLVLACWTMRVPVIYKDFIRIIESYELPYLDPVRLLPRSMTQHITLYLGLSLSPEHAPDVLSLHKMTSRLAKLCYSTYGVFTPELNAAPVLWRIVRCLGGTPTLYALAKRLSQAVSLTLTLHPSLAPKLKRVGKLDPETHKYDAAPPEVTFVAIVIIVVKMVYGLDGRRRTNTAGDIARALPNWDDYLHLLKTLDAEDARSKDHAFSSETTTFVADMDEQTLDEYLEFCQRALLPPEENRPNDSLLDKHFPLSDVASRCAASPIQRAIVHKLPANSPEECNYTLQPGQEYCIYNSRDVAGMVSEDYEVIVARSARWVGVHEDYLSAVVENVERRVLSWIRSEKREQRKEENLKTRGDSEG